MSIYIYIYMAFFFPGRQTEENSKVLKFQLDKKLNSKEPNRTIGPNGVDIHFLG